MYRNLYTCITLRKRNAENRAEGRAIEYTYRHLYRPDHGMFCTIPDEMVNSKGAFVEVRQAGVGALDGEH